jgi:type I restriction enzyme R subunit
VDTKYFANNDSKALYSLTFFWTDAQNKRMTNLQDFSRAFFDFSHLTKMIARYTIINDAEKSLMVMRPYQVYATEALVKQAIETANGGYIWHTTGSGKTLTSFKCSQILAQEPIVKKVFFVVDRSDLDRQTTQEFNKFEADSVDATDNTAILAKLPEEVISLAKKYSLN